MTTMLQDRHMDDLSRWTPEDIDSLPFGYIALSPEGTVRRYNRYEADLARKNPSEVIGKNFFRDVAPCTRVREFEGRFRDFADGKVDDGSLTFDFVFRFRHGTQNVRIAFVRSPLDREVIVTVNRLEGIAVSAETGLEFQATNGRWIDALGARRVPVGEDFWSALAELAGPGRPRHALGREWGVRHAVRVEDWVQAERGRTLREVELQAAVECLSGTAGQLGLGRFDVGFEHRAAGLVRIEHHSSPFTFAARLRSGPCCEVLAGFHAGLFSHLSGRALVGNEVVCGQDSAPCRFVVGTEERIGRLLEAEAGTADADLMAALGSRERPEVARA